MNTTSMKQTSTPARKGLADHFKLITVVQDALAKSKQPLERLEGLQSALQHAQGELSGFSAGEVQALSKWASDGQGAQPEPDHATRRQLV